jgi:hypothetical protein
MINPQRWRLCVASQSSATQVPVRLRLTTMPTGQGSAMQHTPHPLHAAPDAGLSGARAWIRIGRADMAASCGLSALAIAGTASSSRADSPAESFAKFFGARVRSVV